MVLGISGCLGLLSAAPLSAQVVVEPDRQDPLNLTGYWADAGGRIQRMAQDGAALTGALERPTAQDQQVFGYQAHDVVVRGTLADHRVTGQINLRLPLAEQGRCPEYAQRWAPFSLTFIPSEDGDQDRLTGSFQVGRVEVDRDGCRPLPGADTISWEMTRLVPFRLDLDIDSDNNNGQGRPGRDDAEDQVEATAGQPGKFVFSNHNDDDENGVPDYADARLPEPYRADVAGHEQSVIPLIVELRPNPDWPFPIDWSKLGIRVIYPGLDHPPSFTGRPLSADFVDYTGDKVGPMRLWRTRLVARHWREPANYVVPRHGYGAREWGLRDGALEALLILEGTTPVRAGMIQAELAYDGTIVRDRVQASIVEPNLGVNNSNPGALHGDPRLPPGVPDVEFRIDENDQGQRVMDDRQRDDEMVEDQGAGFRFWWNEAEGPDVALDDLTDLAPLVVDVPDDLPVGFRWFLRARGCSIYLYPAVSPSVNRRAFLQTEELAREQIAQHGWTVRDGATQEITVRPGRNEFLFAGLRSASSTRGALILLAAAPGSEAPVPVDSARLTLQGSRTLWWLASARGAPSVSMGSYPVDGTGTVTIQRYPTPAWPAGREGGRRPGTYVVMLHGFNVTEREAVTSFDRVYKRLYWLGLRGLFIGFTWHSDETWRLHTGLWESVPARFDPNVENAFQTAPALRDFLIQVRDRAGGAEHVDLMAHSLGNLVMWEALRLHERLGRGPLARSIFMIEPAVWSEAFDPEAGVGYNGSGDDRAFYSTNQLRQQSWAFWFNQAGHDPRAALAGFVYHSYLPGDSALWAMRLNDFIWRKWSGAVSGLRPQRLWHYYRDRLERRPPVNRAPVGDNRFYDRIPALLQIGHRTTDYGVADLSPAAGELPHPMAFANYRASQGGWTAGAHSDFKDLEFPRIWRWWDEFLGYAGRTRRTARLLLGEE